MIMLIAATPVLAQQIDCGADCGGAIQYAAPTHSQHPQMFQFQVPKYQALPKYVSTPDGNGWFIIQRGDGK